MENITAQLTIDGDINTDLIRSIHLAAQAIGGQIPAMPAAEMLESFENDDSYIAQRLAYYRQLKHYEKKLNETEDEFIYTTTRYSVLKSHEELAPQVRTLLAKIKGQLATIHTAHHVITDPETLATMPHNYLIKNTEVGIQLVIRKTNDVRVDKIVNKFIIRFFNQLQMLKFPTLSNDIIADDLLKLERLRATLAYFHNLDEILELYEFLQHLTQMVNSNTYQHYDSDISLPLTWLFLDSIDFKHQINYFYYKISSIDFERSNNLYSRLKQALEEALKTEDKELKKSAKQLLKSLKTIKKNRKAKKVPLNYALYEPEQLREIWDNIRDDLVCLQQLQGDLQTHQRKIHLRNYEIFVKNYFVNVTGIGYFTGHEDFLKMLAENIMIEMTKPIDSRNFYRLFSQMKYQESATHHARMTATNPRITLLNALIQANNNGTLLVATSLDVYQETVFAVVTN